MKKFEGTPSERFLRTIPRRINFAMNERHVICKWPFVLARCLKKATYAAKILFGDEFREY